MNKVYLVCAKRTAIGSFNGTLAETPATELAAAVIKAILMKTNAPQDKIDELIMGNVLTAGLGQGPAKKAARLAGLPDKITAYGINMVCGSGLKAIINGYTKLAAGFGELIIAGGAENMSAAPYLIPNARQGLKMGNKEIVDHMVFDALTDSVGGYHMGVTAENLAEKFGITREEQDAFALESQRKAINTVDGGGFDDEIVPIHIKNKKEEVDFCRDETPNRTTNAEKMAKLKPAFKDGGTVTAGNASGINDGAAFVLLAGEEAMKKYSLTPAAEIIGIGEAGVEPEFMGLGPVPAIRRALRFANLSLANIDILELNEAFAAQSLAVIKSLAIEHGAAEKNITAKTNSKGGALALGHPIGASGARIVVTLAHIIKAKKIGYGLASLCIGGGMGAALILKSV